MRAAALPFPPHRPAARPRRWLAALAAGVLLAHLALLDTLPLDWMARADRPHATSPLITRRLPAPADAEPTGGALAPAPPVRQRPTPRAAPPSPATPVAPPDPVAMGPTSPPEASPQAPVAPEPAPATAQAAASAPAPAAASDGADAAPHAGLPGRTTPSASAWGAQTGRPPHASVPPPVKLLYTITGEAKRLTYNARSELLWQHDGSHYDARLDITVFLLGTRTQASRGELRPDGLAPQRFADKSRTELAAHVERDKGKISFSANTPDIALLPGAQDRLSLMLQLAALVQGEPQRYPPGTRIPVQTIGPRDADLWEIVVSGPETLELPYGTLDTLKLVRTPRREFDQKLELWLAPALGHLPVRIRLTQANGDFVDQQLRATEAP